MTQVTLSTVDERKTVMCKDTDTIQEILKGNGVNYNNATIMIDGMTLNPTTMRQSLAELGATGETTIATVVKLDNAA